MLGLWVSHLIKINDRVKTEYGTGTIRELEEFKYSKRWGVELDTPSDIFPDDKILYFFEKEMEVL